MNLLLRSASVLALVAAGLAASAQSAATLALSPVYTATRPASGSAPFAVSGTLSGPVGSSIASLGSYPLVGPTGDRRSISNPFPTLDAINAALASTGTYTGRLFDFTFSSADALGTYTDQGVNYSLQTASGGFVTTNLAPFSIALVANPTPEPSALAALGLGAVAFVKRRKKG